VGEQPAITTSISSSFSFHLLAGATTFDVLPKNLPMKPDDDKRRLIPLEDIVATLVIIVILAGVTFLILRWIS
jgi:hypothetical protein